jgi:hypothetical protein
MRWGKLDDLMVKIENPLLAQYIISSMILFAFIASFGIYFLFQGDEIFGVMVLLLALIPPIAIMSRQFLLHPKAMDFNDDGVILKYPLKRLRVIKWQTISEIIVYKGDTRKWVGSPRHVVLKANDTNTQIDLKYEAAQMIRDEYCKRYGHDLSKIWIEQ